MYIERMYGYDKDTDTYRQRETFALSEGNDMLKFLNAVFSLGLKMGEAGAKDIKAFDMDGGSAVIGCECTDKRGLPEYWSVRK